MAFGLTADWDTLKDIEVLARGIERGIDDLAAAASKKAARAQLTQGRGVPVRDLTQPATRRFHLRHVPDAGQDPSRQAGFAASAASANPGERTDRGVHGSRGPGTGSRPSS